MTTTADRNEAAQASYAPADDSAAILAGHKANVADMAADPDGQYPACKNRLWTYLCERCGRDVRGTTDACPAVPREKRWGFKSASPQTDVSAKHSP